MLSQSSPLSMLRLAMFFIFARLPRVSNVNQYRKERPSLPVLEPYLHGPFGHVDILRDAFSDQSSGCRVLVEFDLQKYQLILSRPLTLLVLLLLCKGALPRRTPR